MDTCGHCGSSVPDGASRCPDCGEPREADAPAVPAGTWASTSEPSHAGENDAAARKLRRLPPRREDRDDTPVRPEPAPRTSRADGFAASGRQRGLAVAVRAAEPEADARPPAQVVAFPRARRAEEEPPAPPAEPPPTRLQPRFLASELLRQPIPTEPMGTAGRAASIVCGALAASVALTLGGLSAGAPDLSTPAGTAAARTLLLAGLGLLMLVVGALPIGYRPRAAATALVASVGMAVAAIAQSRGAGLVALGSCFLGAALWLREVHRGSKLAVLASGVGIVSLVAWLATTGGLDALVVQSLDWRAWVEPCLRASLVVVIALSLFAHVDRTSTSGAAAWAILVVGWTVTHAAAAVVLGVGVAPATSIAAAVALPCFVTVAGLAWMQVWAAAAWRGARNGDG